MSFWLWVALALLAVLVVAFVRSQVTKARAWLP